MTDTCPRTLAELHEYRKSLTRRSKRTGRPRHAVPARTDIKGQLEQLKRWIDSDASTFTTEIGPSDGPGGPLDLEEVLREITSNDVSIRLDRSGNVVLVRLHGPIPTAVGLLAATYSRQIADLIATRYRCRCRRSSRPTILPGDTRVRCSECRRSLRKKAKRKGAPS